MKIYDSLDTQSTEGTSRRRGKSTGRNRLDPDPARGFANSIAIPTRRRENYDQSEKSLWTPIEAETKIKRMSKPDPTAQHGTAEAQPAPADPVSPAHAPVTLAPATRTAVLPGFGEVIQSGLTTRSCLYFAE